MLSGFFAVARLSLAEVLYKRIMAAAAVLTLGYLFLFGLGMHYLGRNWGSGLNELAAAQLFSLALYVAVLLVSLLAVLLGVGAIAGEIESGTAHAVLSRPLSRTAFLLGKYTGYAAFMALYALCFFLGLWLLMAWQAGVALTGFGPALGLFMLQPLVLLSLAFWASTVFSTIGAGVVVFILYGLNMIGGLVEQIGALLGQAGHESAPALVNLGIVSSLILPVDALYRLASFSLLANSGLLDAWSLGAMGPFGTASVPSVWMVVYALLYAAALLWLAARIFRTRDV
ncbi:MAG: ABC transporter permease subunit [Candidatus Desulforudis sp.]|nr:ABC transporter permease subunit [Desulforudis sp.]